MNSRRQVERFYLTGRGDFTYCHIVKTEYLLQKANLGSVFDRQAVFAEVDKSNVRFEDYTKEQRMVFATEARAQKLGVIQSHEARRARH